MNWRMTGRRLAAWLPVALMAAFLGSACQPQASGRLSVRDAWARPAAAGANGAVYFVIDNGSDQADRLLAVETSAAVEAEFHESQLSDQNVMSMHPQESVAVSARGQVVFAPGGLHVMLIGVANEMKAGDTFSITLRFESAGPISVEVSVQAP